MSKVIHILLVAAGLGAAAPGLAAPADANGAREILRGDLAAAERIITRERRMFPADPDLILNLAMIYRQTGRIEQARGLYRQIIDAPDEMLDTVSAPMSAHAIAKLELAQMGVLAAK